MHIIALQCLVTLFFGAFGVTSLLVARTLPASPEHSRAGWLLTGMAFTIFGIDSAAQNVLGTTAYIAGAGAPVYAFYMKVAPAANHSRTFLMLAYCALLVWVLTRKRLPRHWRWTALAALLAGVAAGALVGAGEGPLVERTHYTTVALLDVVEMLILLGSLFVALVSERVDRLLWFALGVYAVSVALNIIWTVALAGVGIGWVPPSWQMHAYRCVLTFAMTALACRRLVLARRGVAVRGLLGERNTPRAAGLAQ
jgi:hypothetical protein